MANKTIPDLPVYGSFDASKARKDLFEVTKNNGTFGSPIYPVGASRKITGDELKVVLGMGGYIPLAGTEDLAGNIKGNTVDFYIERRSPDDFGGAYTNYKRTGYGEYETEIGASTGESGTTWLRFTTNEATTHEGNIIKYNGDYESYIEAEPNSLITKQYADDHYGSGSGGGVEITEVLFPGVIALITDSTKYNDAYGTPGATLGGAWNAAVPSGPSEHDYYIETPNNDGLPKHVITFLKKSGTLKPNRIPYIY